MADCVVQIENVAKRYRLGVMNSGSLKQDLNESWGRITGSVKQQGDEQTISANHIWALRDINFNINRGDSLGFIGKNGAGKSTLLKILSRVTLPTTGRIRGVGRVASLLEVGTGFHPELTGRENVFLNGHILGMKKREIIRKFDEIVDFSGVEQFLDTPVKRYSSGMYVRLSFAVAAHLDSDILIVDEALAVGDAQFQAKCLGKMKDVTAKNGKTVIFVSHNMQAVRNLCQRAIYLEHGRIVDDGIPEKVIANYLFKEKVQFLYQSYPHPEEAPGNNYIRIKEVAVNAGATGKEDFDTTTPLSINFSFWQFVGADADIIVGVHVFDFSGICLFDLQSTQYRFDENTVNGKCIIPANFISPGSYYISFDFIKNKSERFYSFEACLSFDIKENSGNKKFEKWTGLVNPVFSVVLEQSSELKN